MTETTAVKRVGSPERRTTKGSLTDSNPRIHQDAPIKPSVPNPGLLVSAWEANRWWQTAGDVFTLSAGAARRAARAHAVTKCCRNVENKCRAACFSSMFHTDPPPCTVWHCRGFMSSKKTSLHFCSWLFEHEKTQTIIQPVERSWIRRVSSATAIHFSCKNLPKPGRQDGQGV